jgi:hypothetical protein
MITKSLMFRYMGCYIIDLKMDDLDLMKQKGMGLI